MDEEVKVIVVRRIAGMVFSSEKHFWFNDSLIQPLPKSAKVKVGERV
jgi:hypothetical protein